MLRVRQTKGRSRAKNYFTKSDYYLEGQELPGVWRGKAAERLGLTGQIEKQDWHALCDNRNPATGLSLTPRQKDNHIVGYDMSFHPPKSVAILYALTKDERIIEAFRESVNETMQDGELDMKTRVRVNGKNAERTTSNAAWGEFIHLTARPVNGIPDMHVHAHCFVFNFTFDDVERRAKAAQFRDLKRDAPYYEALCHSRLARRMMELGLPVERTRKGWEIAGLSKLCGKFSRRTAVIEKLAKELGIVDAKEKEELGAKTRE